MRRQAILGCCAAVCLAIHAPRSEATHPLLWYDLELVPELSTLTVSGGIAGVHQTYRVEGALGLWVDIHPHPPDTVQAQFGVVDAVLRDGGFFDNEDLDAILRMTEWEGLFADEHTISFTGEDGQHMPIAAVGRLNDSRLHLTGSNMIGCCDFFNYSWDLFALARHPEHGHAHADFDEDGDVDGNDLLNALINFGMAGDGKHIHGDADGDGSVDRLDIAVWRHTAGRGVPAYPAAVPEPTTAVLAMAFCLLLMGWCIRFTRREMLDATT